MNRHVATPNQSQRHTNDRADTRANGVEMASVVDPFTHVQHVNAHRAMSPTRSSAGFCKSCDGPVDAVTAECRCSA